VNAPVFFRVEHGNPGPEELAALTVVLAALAVAGGEGGGGGDVEPGWRRRGPHARVPHSWRSRARRDQSGYRRE
jgi:Acyl-CoA carboxylase epsilon subunit